MASGNLFDLEVVAAFYSVAGHEVSIACYTCPLSQSQLCNVQAPERHTPMNKTDHHVC